MKFIEASLLMPMTCLIVISMIGIMMCMYNHLILQIEEHDIAREEMYRTREVTGIRLYDKIFENM